jgi:hypothetical protein
MADDINAKAITTLTNSGYTAFQISAWRPKSHILVFTSNKRILTQLNLLWGVRAFYYDKFVSTDDTIEDINAICKERKYVKKGDMVMAGNGKLYPVDVPWKEYVEASRQTFIHIEDFKPEKKEGEEEPVMRYGQRYAMKDSNQTIFRYRWNLGFPLGGKRDQSYGKIVDEDM